MGEAYIVAATRTAGGRKGGKLKDWHPVDLAAQVLNNLLDRTNADPALIDRVIATFLDGGYDYVSNTPAVRGVMLGQAIRALASSTTSLMRCLLVQ